MTNIVWTWADAQRVKDQSTANNTSTIHYGSRTAISGGAMSRFLGSGAHYVPRKRASLRPDHPALTEGRTLFMKSRRDPAERPRVLIRGFNNAKTGDFITKGPWAGLHVFTLTLEERATCPRSCDLWDACYGNAMPFALRHQHGPALLEKIDHDLSAASAKHGKFAVRLHILGDFYDENYAWFWQKMARKYPGLHAWGYTHHLSTSRIGRRLRYLNRAHPERFAFRFSVPPGTPHAPMQATTIWREPEATVVPEGQVCPVALGSSISCGTCGLCWDASMRDTTIVFPGHGMRAPKAVVKQGRLL